MKKNYIIVVVLSMLLGFASCDYLDVVPDERPTEEDAFKDKYAAERYLYSCYAFMPQERQIDNIVNHGQTVSSTKNEATHILLGNISAANLGNLQYWSRMYGAFRRCYTFLDNVDAVPRLEEETKLVYKAEAQFLLAYYGFYLLKSYGPFIIPDGVYDYNMPSDAYPKRAKFDDCVQWILDRLDEAYPNLLDAQSVSAQGRATKVIADALRSRVLLYAASPLFNGNKTFFQNTLLDPETGEPLMPLEYDENKWKKALDASEVAIKSALDAGFELYKGDDRSSDLPYPEDQTEYALRMTFVDRENKEVIFWDAREEGYYDWQNESTPRDPEQGDPSWNNNGPSLESVEMFYSENGLPIDEDPAYFPEGDWFKLGEYDGEPTSNLHLKREPRFYAWIAFHNSWYEMQRNDQSRIRVKFRKDDEQGVGNRSRNFSKSGYLAKKGVGLAYSTRNGFTKYPWPLIRLAELYLNAAEAAIESGDLDKGKEYLNVVRQRAGVPDVEVAWKGIATLDKDKLREIVHRERNIELFLEGHYRWDMNRWLESEAAMNHNPHGLNIYGEDDESFSQPVEVSMRWAFTSPANYLLPIETRELNINSRLVQNPGY